MKQIFWNDEWQGNSTEKGKQGTEKLSTEDSTSYDPKGPWRLEQIHKEREAQIKK